jgi:hypothetical protein
VCSDRCASNEFCVSGACCTGVCPSVAPCPC